MTYEVIGIVTGVDTVIGMYVGTVLAQPQHEDIGIIGDSIIGAAMIGATSAGVAAGVAASVVVTAGAGVSLTDSCSV